MSRRGLLATVLLAGLLPGVGGVAYNSVTHKTARSRLELNFLR